MPIPSSTYRVQLNDHFTLRNLSGIIDYLHQLGISTIYASPITTAFKGSSHGYDVTDPLILSPEIGTEEELQQLAATLKNYGMTWLQDIVPNHMAYDSNNPWLYDVLERGKDSAWYSYFDILPHPVELLGDKIMAPFLGSTLTECLQKGELSLQFMEKGFVIVYYDKFYPVAPDLYPWICTVADGYPAGLTTTLDLLIQAAKGTPPDWLSAKNEWKKQVDTREDFLSFISSRISFINQRQALLEILLQGQHYQLTHAHLASSRINYRRFFTVNSLICLQMEKVAVFTAYHERIHYWYTQGWIQGLRIDHIDGLADPKNYIRRLRDLFGKDCYTIAEKILTGAEILPADWDITGTTGYDFLAFADQLLTDAAGSEQLLSFYRENIISLPDYADIVFERKYSFLRAYMGGELDNLLDLLTGDSFFTSDQDSVRLKEALAALMASFPVYRAYPGETPLAETDRQIFASAFARAQQLRPEYLQELACLESFLKGPTIFRSRLVQFTGPLAAKGIEDTTYYVYNPYIALNEVGDSPGKAGLTGDEFHQKMLARQANDPYTLNATSTHDTKRGEDSRIRLIQLSAIPQEWITAVTRWRHLNSSLITGVKGRPAPSANDEYLIYQALLGGFPEDLRITDSLRQRFAGYLTKALREAKAETNYDNPDELYEQQCQQFAAALLQDGSSFLGDFTPFVSDVIRRSFVYSLSLLLIKLTAPGIPDIYQGAELWETSFVDPDNRRPVDFALRAGLLQQIKAEEVKGPEAVLRFLHDHREKGAEKLFTLYRTLHFRNRRPRLFAEGEYIPVVAEVAKTPMVADGQVPSPAEAVAAPAESPVLAYIRRQADDWALVIVPLIRWNSPLPASLSLQLPAGAPSSWSHLFTGDRFSLNGSTLLLPQLWEKWPVVLLMSDSLSLPGK